MLRGISGILWLMKFTHYGLQIEIPEDWWTEAGMRGFVPTFTADFPVLIGTMPIWICSTRFSWRSRDSKVN